jgi:sigma-B regulation protein RsbU (phosphoserine phosphatase)
MTSETYSISSDRLAVLYRLSQTFNSTLDINQVLNLVIDEVIAAFSAERGFVMLINAEGGFEFRVARGLDKTDIDQPESQVSQSIVDSVLRDGEPILSCNVREDERFNQIECVSLLGLLSVLCVPLKIKNNFLGVIYLDSRLQTCVFDEDDLELLTAIASNAAIAIENARLYRLAVQQGRLERELQMAREVQMGLLPQTTPRLKNWEFASHWQPANEVSGDYYDFINIPDKGLGIVIADVTDKGMAAALFMAFIRSTIRACLRYAATPASNLTCGNQLILEESTNGMFVTLFYVLLDPHSGDITYVNAGHNPPFCYSKSTDSLFRLERTGMALGVEENTAYTQATKTLLPGDFLLLFTDGLVDSHNEAGEAFGVERLEKTIFAHRADRAAVMVSAIKDALHEFTGNTPCYDDMTLIAVRRL